jgi:hypothetical protein
MLQLPICIAGDRRTLRMARIHAFGCRKARTGGALARILREGFAGEFAERVRGWKALHSEHSLHTPFRRRTNECQLQRPR